MRTLVGMWEPGFSKEQQFLEWRMWKQVVAAFGITRWLMAGEPLRPRQGGYEEHMSMERALASLLDGQPRFFLIPGHGVSVGSLLPDPDAAIITGNVHENLKRYVRPGDEVLYIPTPTAADLFAVTCLPAVLYER